MRIINKYKKPLLAAIALLLLPIAGYGAAWTKAKGKWQSINTSSMYKSNKYYDANNESQSSGQDYGKYDVSRLYEYGYRDDLTIGYNLNINSSTTKLSSNSSQVFDLRGCGVTNSSPLNKRTITTFEADLFFRKRLYDENGVVISVQPLIKTPCFYLHESDYGVTDNFDIEMRFLSGVSYKLPFNAKENSFFTGQYHFAGLETAYRYRSGEFADQIRLDATAGFNFGAKTMLLSQAFGTISTQKEKVEAIEFAANDIYFRRDTYSALKLQLSAVQKFTDKTSVQLGVFTDVYGKNSGDGTGAIFSIWREF